MIMIDEPDVNETISILRGIREKYEAHHGVQITDAALVAASILSERYISDRFLPDKAIDLVDEACARLKMEIDSMPQDLDELQRKIKQLEIEKISLKKDKDPISKERLAKIKKEIASLKEKQSNLLIRWEHEKNLLKEISNLSEEIDQIKAKIEIAERKGELDEVAKLKYGELNEKQKELQVKKEKIQQIPSEQRLLKEEVDEEMIAQVVSKWTGIPVSKLMQSEIQRMVNMEAVLSKRVIGQKEAIVAVSNAIRRSRSGLADETRPIGSFMFMGPTGVGKTELAKALAEFLFNTEKSIIRIDMTEFMEKHTVARLIGAPPGYVGYEEGGYLTEAVRRKPYSVILFDEIEKAHHDVFNVLLQILDDGRLTDGKGRTVDFRSTVIIMTSNIGSQLIFDRSESSEQELRPELMKTLQHHFRPEFLNRLDEIIIFHKLSKEELQGIVKIQLAQLTDRLADKHLYLEFTDDALQKLAELGFDPQFGARPLKRVIQQKIENKLALMLLENEIKPHDRIKIDYTDDEFVFQNTENRGE